MIRLFDIIVRIQAKKIKILQIIIYGFIKYIVASEKNPSIFFN